MEIHSFLLAMLNAMPDRKLAGRKRLQKTVHLLKEAGADVDASFQIHHYGPFSYEVASAIDELAFIEKINEKFEPVGPYHTTQSVYVLSEDLDVESDLRPEHNKLLKDLGKFSTVVLEVTSTIAYFEGKDISRDEAIKNTAYLKPTKTISPVLERAEKILEMIFDVRERTS